MDMSISKLLGEGALPPELLASLQEAFDKKVAEARAEAEAAVREDFAARYEHDRSNLVEAMDRMLTDVVQKHADERAAAVQGFVEARKAFRTAVREARGKYATKLNENLSRSRTFVAEQLKIEIVKLREQKKALVKERLKAASRLKAMREAHQAELSKRVGRIDEFVVAQVRKELTEFAQDHRALVETRVKLVSESRRKLRETQARFVKEAARNVEKAVNESLAREMTQLHEDLERNRQNMFGRRIFEAVAAEYLTSYLAEGTEIRKLQNMLESKDAALKGAEEQLNEATKVSQQASRRLRLAEDRAARAKVMSELLTNLRGEKRTVMEGMLETVKTEALRETFNKLLPVVLDETARKPAPAKQRVLNEGRPVQARATGSVVTGDHRDATRIFESAQSGETNDFDRDIAQVVRLAGIQR